MVELEFEPRHFGFRNGDLHHHFRLLLNGIQNKFQARKICIKSSDFITSFSILLTPNEYSCQPHKFTFRSIIFEMPFFFFVCCSSDSFLAVCVFIFTRRNEYELKSG